MELVIFDCDGVLVDSEPLFASVEVEVLQECGCEITVEDYTVNCSGRCAEERVEFFQRHCDFTPDEFFWRNVSERLPQRFYSHLQPIPGIHDALETIPHPKCVASNSDLPTIEACLKLTKLLHFFQPHIFSWTMVQRPKPEPHLFLHAAEKMGVAPKECVVIEDSAVGVAAGVAAGMKVIGFLGGSHRVPADADHLRSLGAYAICEETSQLSAMLE
jgi:HAD superfamily hydrolase (TIGR01509 family)